MTVPRRSPMPPRSAPMNRVAAKSPGRVQPARRKTRKGTGPDRKTRGLVLARDNWQCVACGKPVGGACTWWSLQHRKARGQGGGNEAWNLIVLCGSAVTGCHGRCETRSREMHAAGHWLESWQDPETEPVMLHGEQGGVTVWLAADGTYSLTAPAAMAHHLEGS